jgi:hypothetical protein
MAPGWCPVRRGRRKVRITAAQAAIIGQALADAEAWRRKRAGGWCRDCEQHPAGACEQHLNDLDTADAYAALGRQFQEGESSGG